MNIPVGPHDLSPIQNTPHRTLSASPAPPSPAHRLSGRPILPFGMQNSQPSRWPTDSDCDTPNGRQGYGVLSLPETFRAAHARSASAFQALREASSSQRACSPSRPPKGGLHTLIRALKVAGFIPRMSAASLTPSMPAKPELARRAGESAEAWAPAIGAVRAIGPPGGCVGSGTPAPTGTPDTKRESSCCSRNLRCSSKNSRCKAASARRSLSASSGSRHRPPWVAGSCCTSFRSNPSFNTNGR